MAATFTTTQVVDMLVNVLSKSAGLEGFNVVDVSKTDSNTLSFKILVPQGNPAGPHDENVSPPDINRYQLRTVTIDVAIA